MIASDRPGLPARAADINVVFDPTTIVGLTLGGTLDPAIILYSTAANHDGNLGGRSGADGLCFADKDRAGRTCSSVRSMLSFSGDTIAFMPSNYSIPDLPLKSSNGTLVANRWADTLTGGTRLLSRLDTAGVVFFGYWTFTTTAGTYAGDNCTGGTSTVPQGAIGDYGVTTQGWLYSSTQTCGGGARILCVCY